MMMLMNRAKRSPDGPTSGKEAIAETLGEVRRVHTSGRDRGSAMAARRKVSRVQRTKTERKVPLGGSGGKREALTRD